MSHRTGLMISKKAFENWYFEYIEAEREFLDVKRSLEVKRRDACLFLYSAYAKWCVNKFGEVLRPGQPFVNCDVENPVSIFFADYNIDSTLQRMIARLLNQAYDERLG